MSAPASEHTSSGTADRADGFPRDPRGNLLTPSGLRVATMRDHDLWVAVGWMVAAVLAIAFLGAADVLGVPQATAVATAGAVCVAGVLLLAVVAARMARVSRDVRAHGFTCTHSYVRDAARFYREVGDSAWFTVNDPTR